MFIVLLSCVNIVPLHWSNRHNLDYLANYRHITARITITSFYRFTNCISIALPYGEISNNINYISATSCVFNLLVECKKYCTFFLKYEKKNRLLFAIHKIHFITIIILWSRQITCLQEFFNFLFQYAWCYAYNTRIILYTGTNIQQIHIQQAFHNLQFFSMHYSIINIETMETWIYIFV